MRKFWVIISSWHLQLFRWGISLADHPNMPDQWIEFHCHPSWRTWGLETDWFDGPLYCYGLGIFHISWRTW